jgi:hypothetical protein
VIPVGITCVQMMPLLLCQLAARWQEKAHPGPDAWEKNNYVSRRVNPFFFNQC